MGYTLANGRIVTEENETDMDGCRSGTFYGKIPALALRNA
jgi:hypothetical protein